MLEFKFANCRLKVVGRAGTDAERNSRQLITRQYVAVCGSVRQQWAQHIRTRACKCPNRNGREITLQFAKFGLSEGNSAFRKFDVVTEQPLFIHCDCIILDQNVSPFVKAFKFINNSSNFLLLLIDRLSMSGLR